MAIRDYKLTFAGGETWELKMAADFFRILSATAPLLVSLDNGPFVTREIGQAQQEPFSSIRVQSTVAQNVVIAAGKGGVTDNRQNINVIATATIDPANTLENSGDVTVGAGLTVQIAAGNIIRKKIFVQSAFTNDPAILARIGNAGVDANSGLIIQAGQSMPLEDITAAVFCHNPGASDIKICVAEFTKV